VDLIGTLLKQLQARAAEMGLDRRVRTCRCDMSALPFADGSFDLIWSEGAVYIMGFDEALVRWRPLLKPRGYLVLSELSWFRPDAPPELREFWELNFPAMRSVEENLAAARDLGWTPVGRFHLPVSAWTEGYYGPLTARIPVFRRAHGDDPDARAVADMTEHEISLMSRYGDYCGYEFYVLRPVEPGAGHGTAAGRVDWEQAGR
jgi:SAM-dependent methyltransferase